MIPPALATGIVVLVTVVWMANFLAPLLISSYTGDPQLNLVFMSIVGGALALRRDKNHTRKGPKK